MTGGPQSFANALFQRSSEWTSYWLSFKSFFTSLHSCMIWWKANGNRYPNQAILIGRFWSTSEGYRQSTVCRPQKVLPPRNDSDERQHPRLPIKMSILQLDCPSSGLVFGCCGRNIVLYQSATQSPTVSHMSFNGHSNLKSVLAWTTKSTAATFWGIANSMN